MRPISTRAIAVKSWLLTVDHKRIAVLYMLGDHVFLLHRRAAATLIRLELMTPAGDLMQAETYNKMFTLHGVMMVFFFLIPSIPAVLGNFLVPLMIGARDLAFPEAQSAELVPVHDRRDDRVRRDGRGRRRYGLDVLHALLQRLFQHLRRR